MANDKAKKAVTIIVEGTEHEWPKEAISYAEVVTLEVPNYAQHPEITYSVRYKRGQGGKPDTWLTLARQNRYTYSKIARLMQRLAERDLLRDSVIVAMSDMGDPARHSSRQIPTLLAGGWALTRPSTLPHEPGSTTNTEQAALLVPEEPPASPRVATSATAPRPAVVLEAAPGEPSARSQSPAPTQVPTARSGGRAAPRAPSTPAKSVTSASSGREPSPPAAQSPPPAASTPLRRPKPDWENPFNAVNPELVRAGAARSAT